MRSRERLGRPPVTSRAELEQVALDLFLRHGFHETTLDDIAAAAGIARRTFFGYFSSKNDVVWGDFDALLRGMEAWLDEAPADRPLLDVLTDAVVRFNDLPPEAVPAHRQRMSLILHVPALQAHSTLRYADWRSVVARFAARRLGLPADDLLPQLIGHLSLGSAVAAYDRWLADDGADLAVHLAESFRSWRLRPGR
ncbi:MAG TPA: mycofactocin system transcriptional regulator [Acidimicrobiia bacterium]|nr:mycofactocin system transcriptional regulator [Acidimicrobiia bacterium]